MSPVIRACTQQSPSHNSSVRPVSFMIHAPKFRSGTKRIFWLCGRLSTTFSALAEVQQMSVHAFTSAVVLT